LVQLWPKFLASGAREWVGERVNAGHISGGSFRVDVKAGQLDELVNGGDIADSAATVELGATGLEITYIQHMPPIQTGDVTMRINGRRMALDVPEGWIVLPSGKRVMLGAGRLTVDDLRPDPEIAQIEFQSKGPAQAVLELLDHEPFGYVREMGLKPGDLGGKTTGRFRLQLPLINDLEFTHIKLRGSVDLGDATANSAYGGANVEGGELTFNVTEQAVEARGDILVNGVPAVLSWQRIFDAPPEKQPELRLSTVLNEAAREQLGLKLNHMLRGPVPAIVSIDQIPAGGKRNKVRVQADLSGAELILTNVGWSKPRGRAAVLDFDIGQGVEGNTELQNFRIIGDDIAIDGWISLGEDQWPKAFYFPDFSFNVITQLEVAGKLRNDNVWEVQAHGPAYDGRQFFRSLFSSGQLSDDQTPETERTIGLELSARIGAMVGFFDTTVKDVTIDLVKQAGGRLVALDARGRLNGKQAIAVKLVDGGQNERVVLAESEDAGSAFRLVGFYPRMEGGQASLKVALDALGLADKSGTLWAKDFTVLGDRVVSEVISNASDDPAVAFGRQDGRARAARRQRIPFNQLEVQFSVGGGRFVLNDAYVNGPQLGATLRGNVDIKNNFVDLGGTFIPLYGLNSALGSIPIIGGLLVGRRGEGVLGITFAVKGPAADPRVLVNPVSMVAPGIFRHIFEFTGRTPDSFPQNPQRPAK
ncbi:MAG: AsmA-like C-terminal region-containing protein, partial [Methyloligellaceae bacterium]